MHNIFEHFIDKFSHEIDTVTESLADGNFKTYEDYRYYCGVIRGLRVASTIIAEYKRNLEEAEDE